MLGQFSAPREFDGRFIEITAGATRDVTNSSQAQIEAFGLEAASITTTVLGSLIFALGDNALGSDIVQSVVEQGHRTEGLITHFDLNLRRITDIDPAAARIEGSIAPIMDPARDDLHAALRWYARGGQANDYRDQLLAFHFGIEGIVRRYGKAHGLSSTAAKVAEDETLPQAMDRLMETHPEEAVKSLFGRLTDPQPSIREYVDYYCRQHDLDSNIGVSFGKLSRKRSVAVHGSSKSVSAADSAEARTILELFIKTELDSS